MITVSILELGNYYFITRYNSCGLSHGFICLKGWWVHIESLSCRRVLMNDFFLMATRSLMFKDNTSAILWAENRPYRHKIDNLIVFIFLGLQISFIWHFKSIPKSTFLGSSATHQPIHHIHSLINIREQSKFYSKLLFK